MDQKLFIYLALAAVAGFLILKKWRGQKMQPIIKDFLTQNALIVDVRNPDEYQGGHCKDSLNIPLAKLQTELHKLDKNRPIILCCASGMRSGAAMALLKSAGYEKVINGGPWTAVQACC